LLAALADDGLLFLHDLRRVWWMYWVPIKNGFFQSIRGSYVPTEMEELLQGIPRVCYEINGWCTGSTVVCGCYTFHQMKKDRLWD
jgi:hypothetical protein